MEKLRRLILGLLPLLILGAGAGAFFALKSLRKGPERRAPEAAAPQVRVVRVQPRRLTLTVTGYGTSRFRRQITVVPQVDGRVTHMADRLRVGAFMPKDELLIEIERTNYEHAVQRAQAEVDRAGASITRLEQYERNVKRQIEVMRENVALAERDLRRSDDLRKIEALSEQERESTRRTYLLQKTSLVRFENDLALTPAQIAEARAGLAAAEARLGDAKLDLERTRIVCPFAARVLAATVEIGQVIQRGRAVATVADVTSAEVPVVIEPVQLDYLDFKRRAIGEVGSGTFRFPAKVRWVGHDRPVAWDGYVTRIEPVDPRTRTVPVVVHVGNPQGDLGSQEHPPFLSGMYCRVDIRGRAIDDAISIPRAAFREGGVLHVVREGRLVIQPVHVRYRTHGHLVVGNGVVAGDLVVLSRVSFPVSGMAVEPVVVPEPEQGP